MNEVVALARHASMSSTYKPALLKALVRVVRRGCGSQISLTTVGAEFVTLYWVQTVIFRLRQAATIKSEPEVVRRIRSAAEIAGVRNLSDLPQGLRTQLDGDMASVLKINVLEAFHRSKPSTMEPLFAWSRQSRFITLSEASRSFISVHAQTLEALANLWWAKYLERVNLLAPLVIEKVERDGAKRASLARFLQILRETDEPCCFYCARPFDETLRVHVDQVIPWSFLLTDPLWDLVLACAGCNLAKSDSLPDRRYLSHLVAVNLRRSRRTMPPNYGSPLLDEAEIERFYDAALSVEWPGGWSP